MSDGPYFLCKAGIHVQTQVIFDRNQNVFLFFFVVVVVVFKCGGNQ